MEHPCTARSPLLQNRLLQCGYCTVDPDCGETGSTPSLVHLCLALSASLLKYLTHTLHSSDPISCCSVLVCSCWCWYSATPLQYISYHMFLLCAASNQLPAPTSSAVKSFLATSLHYFFGARHGGFFGSHAKICSFLVVRSSGILTRCRSYSSSL